jgi:hypothetical protein
MEGPLRRAALPMSGQPFPRFRRFRSWRMIWMNGLWGNLEALLGSLRRVRENKHLEPLV